MMCHRAAELACDAWAEGADSVGLRVTDPVRDFRAAGHAVGHGWLAPGKVDPRSMLTMYHRGEVRPSLSESLSDVLAALGYTHRVAEVVPPARIATGREIVDEAGVVVFTGRCDAVWAWLREVHPDAFRAGACATCPPRDDEDAATIDEAVTT